MTRDEMERLLENFRYRGSFKEEMLVVAAKIIIRKVAENGEELSDDLITSTTSAIQIDGQINAAEIDDIGDMLKMVDDELIDKLTLKKELHEGFPITIIEFHATRKGFNEAIKILSKDEDKHGQHTSKMA